MPYVHSRVAKFPPIKCSFWRKIVNWIFFFEIFRHLRSNYKQNYLRNRQENIQKFSWKLVICQRRLGNAWGFIRRFFLAQQNRTHKFHSDSDIINLATLAAIDPKSGGVKPKSHIYLQVIQNLIRSFIILILGRNLTKITKQKWLPTILLFLTCFYKILCESVCQFFL